MESESITFQCVPKAFGRVRKLGIMKTRSTGAPDELADLDFCCFKLRFSFKKIYYEWVSQDEEFGEILRYAQEDLIENTVHLTREQLMSTASIHIIKEKLADWPIPTYWRNGMISHGVRRTRNEARSVVLQGNDVLDLSVEFVFEHHHIFPLSYVMDGMTRDSCMVPATDSSIKSLKRKIIDDGTSCESCSICLDEFCAGCEAVCMPCSHAFHGDCIKTWLCTSHYCPLCRYEMPTNELEEVD